MNRYQILFLLSLFWMTPSVNAQLQKGNLMVGSSISNIDLGFQTNNTTFSFAVQPKLGYFIEDNFALGVEVGLGIKTGRGFTNFDYKFGGFGRYYLSDTRTMLLRHSRFFGEANIGLYGSNSSMNSVSASTNGFGIEFGPGISYFLTPHIGLEASLKYQGIVGFGSSPASSHLSFNVGFQIYLPTKQAREIYEDARQELRSR